MYVYVCAYTFLCHVVFVGVKEKVVWGPIQPTCSFDLLLFRPHIILSYNQVSSTPAMYSLVPLLGQLC